MSSAIRSQIYFFIMWLLQQKTLAQKHTKYAKVFDKLCQIRNKHSKCCQISLNFGKMAKFRTNLVMLLMRGSNGAVCRAVAFNT